MRNLTPDDFEIGTEGDKFCDRFMQMVTIAASMHVFGEDINAAKQLFGEERITRTIDVIRHVIIEFMSPAGQGVPGLWADILDIRKALTDELAASRDKS